MRPDALVLVGLAKNAKKTSERLFSRRKRRISDA